MEWDGGSAVQVAARIPAWVRPIASRRGRDYWCGRCRRGWCRRWYVAERGSTGQVVDTAAGKSIRAKKAEAKKAARKGDADEAWRRMGMRTLKKAVKQDLKCVTNSFGQVREFFARTPCKSLDRVLFGLGDDQGNSVVVSVAWVGFHTRGDARQFKRLDDVHGTGNVTHWPARCWDWPTSASPATTTNPARTARRPSSPRPSPRPGKSATRCSTPSPMWLCCCPAPDPPSTRRLDALLHRDPKRTSCLFRANRWPATCGVPHAVRRG